MMPTASGRSSTPAASSSETSPIASAAPGRSVTRRLALRTSPPDLRGLRVGRDGTGARADLKPGRPYISRADAAHFLMRQLTDDAFAHKTPAIGGPGLLSANIPSGPRSWQHTPRPYSYLGVGVRTSRRRCLV